MRTARLSRRRGEELGDGRRLRGRRRKKRRVRR